MKKKIKVYTNSTCGHCANMKKALTDEKIEFTEVTLEDNQKEWGLVQLITGLGMFPTVKVNDTYFIPNRDFQRPEQMVEIIKNVDKLEELSNDVKLIEAFKTLTFSFNSGFQRLFHQLSEINNKLNKKEDEHKSTN